MDKDFATWKNREKKNKKQNREQRTPLSIVYMLQVVEINKQGKND